MSNRSLNTIVFWLVLLPAVSGFAAPELTAPPMITSEAWGIGNEQGELLAGHGVTQSHEIASLSKVMTLWVARELLDDASLDSQVSVSRRASEEPGTSALLEVGDRLTERQLLHAMMLPSGNDAAWALAEHAGRRLPKDGSTPSARFVKRMNEAAITLGMSGTTFVDPMGTGENVSTVADLLILTRRVMQDDLVRTIVFTPSIEVNIQAMEGYSKSVVWNNTNQLLGDFSGVKTGYTNRAGGCLILSAAVNNVEHYVIVLGSANERSRFSDAYNLFQWWRLKRRLEKK